MTPEEEKQLTEQIIAFIIESKNQGKSDSQIKHALIEKGMDEDTARGWIKSVTPHITENDSGGSSVPGWLIWLGILGVVNLLSYLFDWPFWVY